MKKALLLGSIAMAPISGIVFSKPVFDDSIQTDAQVAATSYQEFMDSSSQSNEIYTKLFGNKEGFMMKINLACGIAPLQPLGCWIGACICDQNGNNCQWTFVCK